MQTQHYSLEIAPYILPQEPFEFYSYSPAYLYPHQTTVIGDIESIFDCRMYTPKVQDWEQLVAESQLAQLSIWKWTTNNFLKIVFWAVFFPHYYSYYYIIVVIYMYNNYIYSYYYPDCLSSFIYKKYTRTKWHSRNLVYLQFHPYPQNASLWDVVNSRVWFIFFSCPFLFLQVKAQLIPKRKPVTPNCLKDSQQYQYTQWMLSWEYFTHFRAYPNEVKAI